MFILGQTGSLLPLDELSSTQPITEIVSFDVFALNPPPYIAVRWQPFPENTIYEYKLYKSMVGFETPNNIPFALLPGDTLILRVNSPVVQTITFLKEYLYISDLVAYLNSVLVGATAYADDNRLMVRANSLGFMELIGGTALPKLKQPARTITEKSEFFLLRTIPYGCMNYYNDMLGIPTDWYCISTANAVGVESKLTTPEQAIFVPGLLCHIHGYIINIQGMRVPDVEISARLVTPPQDYNASASMLTERVSTLSQEDGTFELAILQGCEVIFEINKTRVSETVRIPDEDHLDWNELPIIWSHWWCDNTYASG